MPHLLRFAFGAFATLAAFACGDAPATPHGGAGAPGSTAGGASDHTGGSQGEVVSGGAANQGGGASVTGGANGGRAVGGGQVGGNGSSGTPAAGGNGGSGTNGGSAGAGPSGACVPSSCGSHKWACFPMPSSVGSGLPNEASYTDLGGGIVKDNVTCLEWEKAPATTATDTASWDGALAYCNKLSLGGHADWRVPTRVELATIVDFGKSPAINATAFPGAKGGYYRTSSDWILDIEQIGAGAGKDFAWIYNMSTGLTSNAYSRASAAEVRCVRGNGAGEAPTVAAVPPPNQYTVVAAGEVQDNYTGLIWQAGTSDTAMAFTAAPAYCAALDLNGHEFRVPTMTELTSLVDEAQVGPAINRSMFPGTKSGKGVFYWSSQAYVKSPSQGWGLNFDDGFTGYDSGAAGAWNSFPTAWVRCVR